jgi:DNA-binding NarL/FixJ family response regulator
MNAGHPPLPATPVAVIVRGMTRLVIVDDHTAVRAGVASLLASEPDLTVEASVATAAEAEAECRHHQPHVLVADYHLPDIDGLSLCLRLDARDGPPVVLYSAFADEHLGVLAIVAGARALVGKSADPIELVAAVRAVADHARPPLNAPGPAALHAAGAQLDPDDLPVLGMLTAGVEASEIARTLGIREDWLTARRWAMLKRLRASPPRRPAATPGHPGNPAERPSTLGHPILASGPLDRPRAGPNLPLTERALRLPPGFGGFHG